jgi:DNA-binding NarL/FixJ family response regulator
MSQLPECANALTNDSQSLRVRQLQAGEEMNSVRIPQMGPLAVKNVLVVAPDGYLKDLIVGALEKGSWAMHLVDNNREALRAARGKAFDLILTSEKTAAQKDVELLREIRRIRPHTRLIILTNDGTPADVITSMRECAFSYFSSPYAPDELAHMIRNAVEGPCWDDGIEVLGATPELIQVMVRCDVKTAERLVQFLNEIAELPERERKEVAIAFREMLLNAIEHGGRFDPEQYVEIDYVRARHMVSCHIKDPGTGFTLDEIPHAAVANPEGAALHHMDMREALGMRPGGFGVLLAQRMVDELIYNQDGNEVLLIKYLYSLPLSDH